MNFNKSIERKNICRNTLCGTHCMNHKDLLQLPFKKIYFARLNKIALKPKVIQNPIADEHQIDMTTEALPCIFFFYDKTNINTYYVLDTMIRQPVFTVASEKILIHTRIF